MIKVIENLTDKRILFLAVVYFFIFKCCVAYPVLFITPIWLIPGVATVMVGLTFVVEQVNK